MLALATPVVMAELGWVTMGIVDTIMVGHMSNPALTISAAATPPPMGYSGVGMALLPGLGLFGTFLTAGRRKLLTRKSIASMSALCLVLVMSLFALGCGNNNKSQTNPGATSVMVTGKSGALTSSANVTVTVN